MSMDPLLTKVHEALEEYSKSGALDKLNDTPAVEPAAITGSTSGNLSKVMGRSALMEMRERMLTKSIPETMALLNEQASRKDQGIPFAQWAAHSGNSQAIYDALSTSGPDGQMLQKAIDSTGAGALIRQDLDPMVYRIFVSKFPAWQRMRKVPSNGLVHAFNQITSYGDAQFMPELGTVVDDNNVYNRATSPVAVLARRVGVSLKSQFAVQQGGAGYNLEELEIEGALTAMAHKLQKTIFQGNATASGGTADDENGAYDANAFDGLRKLLASNANNTTVDISSATLSSRGDITTAINQAASNVSNSGGSPSVVYSRFAEHTEWNRQNLQFVRIVNGNDRVEYVPGINVTGIATDAGFVPFVGVPGDSIGFYDNPTKDTADIYVLDESKIVMPYLGSDSITTLDIPIGVAGQLVHYYIVYIMIGFALLVPQFQAKVQAQFEA